MGRAHTRPVRRWAAIFILMVGSLGAMAPAEAHSGGIDRNGGHYCRAAGYRSGKCSPLNSYHCHRSGCIVRRS